jgi:hypothetical protein
VKDQFGGHVVARPVGRFEPVELLGVHLTKLDADSYR